MFFGKGFPKMLSNLLTYLRNVRDEASRRHRFAIANKKIENIDELEEILSKRCCVLTQMRAEIKN